MPEPHGAPAECVRPLMEQLTTSQKLRYVAGRVLRSPASVVIWVVGLMATGFLSGSFAFTPALPLGLTLAAQAALVYARLQDERYLRGIFEERARKEYELSDQQVEELLDQMDFETRQKMRYVLQLQREIMQEARASDVESYAQGQLERIASKIPALVRQAIRIATRKQQLARYLNRVDARAIGNYCTALRARIAGTTDNVTRKQLESALEAREAEARTYEGIVQAAERIDGQLENVEATFASWKAKVIRLKTVDVGSVSSVGDTLYGELESLGNDIDVLDTSVSEALGGGEPAQVLPRVGGQ